jgi:hypothetical protein
MKMNQNEIAVGSEVVTVGSKISISVVVVVISSDECQWEHENIHFRVLNGMPCFERTSD